jgi:tungstate transport system ATP-binding protein
MTTHNLGLARRFGGDIVLLHEGRVAERSPAATFFRTPASAAARQFLQGELP